MGKSTSATKRQAAASDDGAKVAAALRAQTTMLREFGENNELIQAHMRTVERELLSETEGRTEDVARLEAEVKERDEKIRQLEEKLRKVQATLA
jgi:hypothetical protein